LHPTPFSFSATEMFLLTSCTPARPASGPGALTWCDGRCCIRVPGRTEDEGTTLLAFRDAERMASAATALRVLLAAATGAQKARSSLPAPCSAARLPSSGYPRLNAGARPQPSRAVDGGAQDSAGHAARAVAGAANAVRCWGEGTAASSERRPTRSARLSQEAAAPQHSAATTAASVRPARAIFAPKHAATNSRRPRARRPAALRPERRAGGGRRRRVDARAANACRAAAGRGVEGGSRVKATSCQRVSLFGLLVEQGLRYGLFSTDFTTPWRPQTHSGSQGSRHNFHVCGTLFGRTTSGCFKFFVFRSVFRDFS